ncbi:uncharacterized protein LOC130921262 [Corythoichthys intestinalis]|uniref:uncharacterized protein LOC130921262 n=1 Tax=Corythoichthys intestinalis TaxID=161448 RepID=UPI0025A579B0|nr:uncharacterized protein LOC130921262 [Corythoichthys intestinalis]
MDEENMNENASNSQEGAPNRPVRERQLTEKGKQMREEISKRHLKAFFNAYQLWKEVARQCRSRLKKFCGVEDLEEISKQIQSRYDLVNQNYEPLQRNFLNTESIVQKMDACITLTTEISDLVSKRLEVEPKKGTFKAEVEKERVRMILNRDDYGSVFGGTSTESVISEHFENVSVTSKVSSKRADAEADLAAKLEQVKSMQEIQAQQTKLSKLESDWKLHESQMMGQIKQRQADVEIALEEEKAKLKLLQAQMDVNAAAARVRVYNNQMGGDMDAVRSIPVRTAETSPAIILNGQSSTAASPSQLPDLSQNSAANLAEAIASSLTLNRLPVPEPAMFSGDPLKFLDFKMAFTALIDKRPISSCEKMLYLKNYLTGEARKAVEGFFYRCSEDAYIAAWSVLKDRYGNPFVVQKAFRDKLVKWPKIGPSDCFALRDFADFLKACAEAMPHVKGLSILNDSEENHKLLKKLPDWIVRKWSRIVVEELDTSEDYPTFEHFVEFLQKEARIACNPIASPWLLGSRSYDEKFPRRAKAFNINTLVDDDSREGPVAQRPRLICFICEDDRHGIAKCPVFASKSMKEKRAIIYRHRLCFSCLCKGHMTKDCRTKHICGECGQRHPTCMHEAKERRMETRMTRTPGSVEGGTDQEVHTAMSHALVHRASATSSIVPVFLSSEKEPQKEILTYALLDTQSDSTFVLESLVKELDVTTRPLQLRLSTMTALDTLISSQGVSGLRVRSYHHKNYLQLRQAYTRDFIPVDMSCIPTRTTALQWPHLEHLASKLPTLQDCDVGLLIGYDCPLALAPLEAIRGSDDEPFAQRTELGWSIIGATNPHLERLGSHSYVHRVTVRELAVPSASDILKILESDFNERNSENKFVSQEDVRFIQLLSKGINLRHDDHLEMPLPFKGSSPPSLPNNKRLAVIRLEHLKKRLKVNPAYFEHYQAFMADVIKKGDAEPAPESLPGDTVWYIPHHGVYHPRKPGKLRVVFDCSAKFHGISLNDTLLTGPDLINSLVGVLCRFRKETVAVICDIERMFHQFFVTPAHRTYLRFLWWEHGNLESEPREYQMAVHLFGAASSPGCANFGLKYLAQKHQSDYPAAASFVQNGFYVDDGLVSVPTVKEASALIVEAQELCRKGGLRLHKFNTNNQEVLSCVHPADRTVKTDCFDLTLNPASVEHALGVRWLMESDSFSFSISLKDRPYTRRGILSVVASLYDPLGFVAPFVLSGKRILQEMCRRSIGWDDLLPEDLYPRWEEWKTGLQSLGGFFIPRCYHPPDFGKVVKMELHHFSDASSVGYGACSYLKYTNNENKIHCSLVMAKTRVAPTKITSIPRLELSAAVTAARLSNLLKSELNMDIDEEYFWTDSQVTLAYINNDARRFHVFVANRIQLIKGYSSPEQWHYIETTENPADHVSRGLKASDIFSTNWLSGPRFLWMENIYEGPRPSTDLMVGDPEVKIIKAFVTTVYDTEFLHRLSRFSSWSTLLKVVARIMRLFARQKCHASVVTVTEREEATRIVVKLVQRQAFSKEITLLEKGKCLPSSSSLFKLNPFIQEGMLRVGGRLKHSSLSAEFKHPFILPKDGHIIQLIITYCHQQICHQGRNQTQMEIRSRGFWIIGCSKLVAKLIHKCVRCRKLRRPVEEQQMAELPKERVEASAPFTNCGMDCFGPFLVQKNRKEHKRYGLLFTCLYSRAVHLEMLEDLSTDSFINSLRCFISIRGAVRQLHCDQGRNFIGARNELKESLKRCDSQVLQAFLADQQCEFIFNAPAASHAGGIWERQIRTIRNVLNATLVQGGGRLDDTSLRTLFYEAMAIVNSRPLTVDGLNDPDSLEPLTPNHLIQMKPKMALPPPGKFVSEDVYSTKRWRRVQYLIEQFWSRWKREYLANISTRQKWHVARRNLKVDDVVIIKEDLLPRNQWQLGRIVETTVDSDGLVRRVKVRVARNGKDKSLSNMNPSVVERPVQKLVLLLEN